MTIFIIKQTLYLQYLLNNLHYTYFYNYIFIICLFILFFSFIIPHSHLVHPLLIPYIHTHYVYTFLCHLTHSFTHLPIHSSSYCICILVFVIHINTYIHIYHTYNFEQNCYIHVYILQKYFIYSTYTTYTHNIYVSNHALIYTYVCTHVYYILHIYSIITFILSIYTALCCTVSLLTLTYSHLTPLSLL